MKGGKPEKRAYPAIVVEMFYSAYQRTTTAGSAGRTSLTLSSAYNVPFASTRAEDLRIYRSVDGTKYEALLTYSLSKWGPIGPSSKRTVIAFSCPGLRSDVVEPNEMARRGPSKSRLSKGSEVDPSTKRSALTPTTGECSPNSSDRSHLLSVRPPTEASTTANLRAQILSAEK